MKDFFESLSTDVLYFSFQTSQISLFQLIFTDFGLLKNLLTGKLSTHVLKNTLARHYKTLQRAYILKTPPDSEFNINIIYTENNIYWNSWTKFPAT